MLTTEEVFRIAHIMMSSKPRKLESIDNTINQIKLLADTVRITESGWRLIENKLIDDFIPEINTYLKKCWGCN